MSEVALLQALLAAEHAAVWAYGVLGARLPDPQAATARVDEGAHRTRRDTLTDLLRGRRADVPAAQAAYDVAVDGPPAAVALAVRVEEGLDLRWRDLVEGTDDAALRRLGVSGLVDGAVRAAQWRAAAGAAPSIAFPGTPPSPPAPPPAPGPSR